MSHILDHIMARRSVRRFEETPLARGEILDLLRAGMAAPSASNRKPWEFVVVTDEDTLRALRNRLPLGRHRAPAAIVVCGNMRRTYPPPGQDFWVQDCSAAAQNILLAATGMDLGAVWVGIHPIGLLRLGVSRALGLPRHIKPLGLIYLGHPAESKPPRTQFDVGRVHWQRFGAVEGSTSPLGDSSDRDDGGV